MRRFDVQNKKIFNECQKTYDQVISCLGEKNVKKEKNNLFHRGRRLDGYFLDMNTKDKNISIKRNYKGRFYLNVPENCVYEYTEMSKLIKKALGIK